ncbi:MAG: hypothetical protein AB7W47_02225 [Calditrichaceae bacterium]
MNTLTLTNQIEAFIAASITNNYNTHINDVLFLLDKGKVEESSHSVKNNDITLSGIYPGMIRERFRLPQTRIYFTVIQNDKLKIQTIEFQNDTIVIISVFTGTKRIKLKINQNNNYHVLSSLDPEAETSALFDFSITESAVVWVTNDDKMSSINQLMPCINELYQAEIACHPIHQISSENKHFLMNIDECWAQLDCISKGREIRTIISTQKFIWLQEIYLYFGWYDELSFFYKYKHSHVDDLNESDKYWLAIAHNRFILSYQNQKQSGTEKVDNFFNDYINGELIDNPELNRNLQSFWERISKPAMRAYFERSFMTNPHEIIAFGLLATDRQFWWADTLRNKILKLIAESADKSFRSIIELLFYLKSDHLNIAIITNGLHFTGTSKNYGRSEVKMTDTGIRFKSHQVKSVAFTSANQMDVFSFRVNRKARIHYQAEKKSLKIYPVVFQPPVIENSLNFIQIESSNIKFDIPLIWRDFIAEINGNRFKFILKKDRYQVNIKRKPSEEALCLNSEKILFEDSLYTKIYINIKKRPSQSYFMVYDQNGARIDGFGPHIKSIVPRGHGYDMMGSIIEEYQISSNQSSKSSRTMTNSMNPEAIDVASSELHLKFRAKKCLPVSLNFPGSDGSFWRLSQTDSDLLKNRLIFYLQNYTDKKNVSLRELCAKYLGFYPSIKRFNELIYLRTQFAVIVGSGLNFENEIKFDGYSAINLKEAGNKRAIYIEENRLEYFLKNFSEMGHGHIK